jgi:hypothetical protein
MTENTYSSDTAAITLNIEAVNDAPTAEDIRFSTDVDTTSNNKLRASDIDGDNLIYTVDQQGTKGLLTITDSSQGTFNYVPNTGEIGSDTVTYSVYDAHSSSNTASIYIDIIPADVADLAFLSTSGGSVSPVFDADTVFYSLGVGHATTDITVTASVYDDYATMTVNAEALGGGGTSSPIILDVGINIIDIEVTAQDGSSKRYTLEVTREPSSNANLADLIVGFTNLIPTFSSENMEYRTYVGESVNRLSITPIAEADTAQILVNGTPVSSGAALDGILLHIGGNSMFITVTAQDAQTVKTYKVIVTRAAPEKQFIRLEVSGEGAGESTRVI